MLLKQEKTENDEQIHTDNQVTENTTETIKADKKATTAFDHETMERIEKIMDEQRLFIKQDLNVKQLALAMGVTQKKIMETFRQHPQSISFNDYINEKRVNHACELLKEHPEYTVEAIAIDSGFSSPITFYRWFEKQTGMKPKEYRKANTPS